VALSLRLPSPGITRHLVSEEPGLSSAHYCAATIRLPILFLYLITSGKVNDSLIIQKFCDLLSL
jgi:hypothetical protein